jgi:LysM repeat protein
MELQFSQLQGAEDMRIRNLLILMLSVVLIIGGVLAARAQTSTNQSYTVEAYDSLDKIGARFDVQVACLAEVNDLSGGEIIKPGQQLIIDFACPRYDGFDFVLNPRDPNANVTQGLGQGGGGGSADQVYQVQRGDTLDTIGQALNVSVVALQVANDIKPGAIIQPGLNLVIPAGAPKYGEFPILTNPANPTSDTNELGQGGGAALGPNDQEYVVQRGDTLDGIAAQFDVKTSCLAEGNSLDAPSKIYPGQYLVVKMDCPRYDGYAPVLNPRGA